MGLTDADSDYSESAAENDAVVDKKESAWCIHDFWWLRIDIMCAFTIIDCLTGIEVFEILSDGTDYQRLHCTYVD